MNSEDKTRERLDQATSDQDLKQGLISKLHGPPITRAIYRRQEGFLNEVLREQGKSWPLVSRRTFGTILLTFAAAATLEEYDRGKKLLFMAHLPHEALLLSEAFAEHISRQPYNVPDVTAGYHNRDHLSEGEKAIVSSFSNYRAGNAVRLAANLPRLEAAFKLDNQGDTAKAILLSRLMTDTGFLNRGDESRIYANQIDFAKIHDATRVRAVDVSTIVTLNTIDPYRFVSFDDQKLIDLGKVWASLGSVVDLDPIEAFDHFGVETVGFLQQRWFSETRDAAKRGDDRFPRRARDARAEYLRELKRRTIELMKHSKRSLIAENYFYSLHRPTFHAAALDDQDELKRLLETYFHEASDPTLKEATNRIGQEMSGSSPWMFLLDSVVNDDADRFAKLITNFRKSGAPNSQLARTAVEVGVKKFHYDRLYLEAVLDSDRTATETDQTTMHQVYQIEIGRRLAS